MVGAPQLGGTVQIVSIYLASPEARPPSFLGKPAVRPRGMAGGAPTPCAGDIESNPGPKATLKTLSHTRTQPPTLNKYTNLSVQPPNPPHTCPKPSHPLHQPPHSLPTLLTEYNLHVPTIRTYSHHTNIHTTPPPQYHPFQLFTSPHPHPHNVTHEIPPKQNTKK